MQQRVRAAEAAAGNLFQSFEGMDFTDGWQAVSKTEGATELWSVAEGSDLAMLGLQAPDGNNVAMINYSSDYNDQWLVSPLFHVNAGDVLTFWSSIGPFFFNALDNVDWDNMIYTSDPVRIGDLEVLASTDGQNWTKIFSAMDTYEGLSLSELLAINEDNFTVALSNYDNQDIQIAFRYWATDANTLAIDAVKTGAPSLEGIAYMEPLETWYYGFSPDADWTMLTLDLAFYPVFAPLTWTNMSDTPANYFWNYHNPETNDLDLAFTSDLTAEYAPDYTSEFTRRNNLYYAPTLEAIADNGAEGSYTRGYSYFQAGGKPEFSVTNSDGSKEIMNFGLLPFCTGLDGISVVTVDDENIGDPAIPIFGHNVNSDRFWLNYTLNGEEPAEGDDVRLTGILNVVYPSSQPMVVTGAHVLGYGQIAEGARFRLDIYGLGEDFVIDDSNIVATAYCDYADMLIAENGANDRINTPFTFATPYVLDNTYSAYVFKFSGFNSDAVTYYVPVQQEIPDKFMCHGFIEKQMKVLSDEYRTSYSPLANFENSLGAMYSSFAINVSGYYPYLTAEKDRVELAGNGSSVNIALGSYYDGSELSIEAPQGVTATIEGRYDSAVLKVTCTDETKAAGTLHIFAPGIEKSFPVTSGDVGVSEITSTSAAVTAIYSIDGRVISARTLETLPAGIYLVKYADGTTRKTVIR